MYNSDNTIFIQKLGHGWPKPDEKVTELKGMTVAEYVAKEILIPMAEDINKNNANLNEIYLAKLKELKQQLIDITKNIDDKGEKSEIQSEKTKKVVDLRNENTKLSKRKVRKIDEKSCNVCKKSILTESFGECIKCKIQEHILSRLLF